MSTSDDAIVRMHIGDGLLGRRGGILSGLPALGDEVNERPACTSCSVTVEPFFCLSGNIDYRLDVSGINLTLVTDDGNPASPSGAFVDAPTGEVPPGA